MQDIYERIKEKANEKNLTGKELGDLLGLKKSPLTDWKNQKSCPTLEQLMKMCDIFASSADYLLFGKIQNLSKDQQELLDTYSKLDRRGQHRIHTIIYEEIDRIEKESEKSYHSDSKNLAWTYC